MRFFLTVACVEPGKIHRVRVPHESETHGGTVRFFKKLPVAHDDDDDDDVETARSRASDPALTHIVIT